MHPKNKAEKYKIRSLTWFILSGFFLLMLLFYNWLSSYPEKEDLIEVKCTLTENVSIYEQSKVVFRKYTLPRRVNRSDVYFYCEEYPQIKFIINKNELRKHDDKTLMKSMKKNDVVFVHVIAKLLKKHRFNVNDEGRELRMFSLRTDSASYLDLNDALNELSKSKVDLYLLFGTPITISLLLGFIFGLLANKKAPSKR